MPDKEQDKEHSKISMRIGDIQVEFEGTSENIKKLMDKEMFNLAKKLEATAKQAPPSPESAPKPTQKTPETAPKVKTAPPPSKHSASSAAPDKKTTKSGKKKTNWRNVATAMMIACIVLLASVFGVIAFYWPTMDTLNAQIVEKDLTIGDLAENVTALTDQISNLQSSINQKDNTIANLQNSIDPLNSVIAYYLSIMMINETSYLVEPTTFTLNASESGQIYQFGLDYAGYASVSIESSSNTTYVQLSYKYKEVDFDQNVTVAESGTAYFPILPAVITIRIGNTDTYTGENINGTVSARYFY